jgi:hypothetical protein
MVQPDGGSVEQGQSNRPWNCVEFVNVGHPHPELQCEFKDLVSADVDGDVLCADAAVLIWSSVSARLLDYQPHLPHTKGLRLKAFKLRLKSND